MFSEKICISESEVFSIWFCTMSEFVLHNEPLAQSMQPVYFQHKLWYEIFNLLLTLILHVLQIFPAVSFLCNFNSDTRDVRLSILTYLTMPMSLYVRLDRYCWFEWIAIEFRNSLVWPWELVWNLTFICHHFPMESSISSLNLWDIL